MQQVALIVAGGSGSRMGSAVPKQFLDLVGKPILRHTLEKFAAFSPDIQLILVLPESDFFRWKGINWLPTEQTVKLIPGGATRFQSVKNGLQAVSGDGLVAIHDAVRPLVSVDVIRRTFEAAAAFGSGVAAVPAKDSVRQILENDKTVALDRSSLRLVQTPQTFQIRLIKKAFEQPESPLFTDDASVVEAAGFPVHLVEGSYENLKITTPEDLRVAEALLNG
jgi:2-C-methyl-D-erythritol 4-phosphate cytidylyltransferase